MKGSKIPLGDPKSWRLVYDAPRKENGKRNQIWVTFHGTSKQADAERARLIHEAESGQYVDPSKMTVDELLQKYLDANEGRWARKTHLGYSEKIKNYISPQLGNTQIEKLTASRIDKFLSEIQKTGRKKPLILPDPTTGEDQEWTGVSSQTANHCRAILRSAINWGIRKEVIKLNTNPVSRTDSIKVKHEEMKTLTAEESVRLVDACNGSIWEMPIVLSLYTGMRQGECLALRWSDVDFKAGTIKVRHSLQYIQGKLSLKVPKNDYSERTFEATPELLELLKKHKEVQKLRKLEYGDVYQNLNLVCAMEDGYYMRTSMLCKGLREIIDQAKVTRIRFHDLRHTHISLSLANGESLVRVSRRVGHADPTITLKRYSHCIPGDMGAPVQLADALKRAREQ
ncbi:MAG: tyrosine-type recombinase/integrase [Armatimonadota bacterium]